MGLDSKSLIKKSSRPNNRHDAGGVRTGIHRTGVEHLSIQNREISNNIIPLQVKDDALISFL